MCLERKRKERKMVQRWSGDEATENTQGSDQTRPHTHVLGPGAEWGGAGRSGGLGAGEVGKLRHGAPDLQTPLHSPRENMLLETGDAFVDHQLCAGAPRVRLVPSSVPKSWVARGPGRRRSPEKGPRAQRLKAVSRGRKRKLPNRWEEGLGRKGACLPSRRKAHAWGQRLEEQNAW